MTEEVEEEVFASRLAEMIYFEMEPDEIEILYEELSKRSPETFLKWIDYNINVLSPMFPPDKEAEYEIEWK